MSLGFTKCQEHSCPLKAKCHRYTSNSIRDFSGKESYQEYFDEKTYTIKDGKFNCDFFWGDNAEFLYQNLVNIMEGKFNN